MYLWPRGVNSLCFVGGKNSCYGLLTLEQTLFYRCNCTLDRCGRYIPHLYSLAFQCKYVVSVFLRIVLKMSTGRKRYRKNKTAKIGNVHLTSPAIKISQVTFTRHLVEKLDRTLRPPLIFLPTSQFELKLFSVVLPSVHAQHIFLANRKWRLPG